VGDKDWEAVRREPDPIKRGRMATDLLGVYQQRSTELARLRRAAIEEARDLLGGNYADVARAFGLTKGRITQIRSSAPPVHRAFFGVGPLTVALPGRIVEGRRDLVIAAEDDHTGNYLIEELNRLAFSTHRVVLDPREDWRPAGDAVVICGPASAPVGAALMADDPRLAMRQGDDGLWRIVDRRTSEQFVSPMDEADPAHADHAYIARHATGGGTIVHIAGLHALGSIGAARYLVDEAPRLFATLGETAFSMAVTSRFVRLEPVDLATLIQPQKWPDQ
jgi:hypothetical protein